MQEWLGAGRPGVDSAPSPRMTLSTTISGSLVASQEVGGRTRTKCTYYVSESETGGRREERMPATVIEPAATIVKMVPNRPASCVSRMEELWMEKGGW